MNKKRLSVVMAGAMLASSVAPVLAAETVSENYKEYKVNKSNRGILIRDLRNLLNNNLFSDVEGNNKPGHDYRGESIYYVEVAGTQGGTGNGIYLNHKDGQYKTVADLEKLLQDETKSVVGTTITVKSRGFQEVNGKKYAYAQSAIEGTQPKYITGAQLEKVFTDWRDDSSKLTNYPAVYKMEYKAGVLTVTYRKAAGETTLSTLEYKVGDEVRDFKVAVDKDGEAVGSDFSLIENFKLAAKEGGTAKDADINDELLAKVTLSDVDAEHEVALSSLYDGLFLTEDGQKLLNTIKEFRKTDGCSVTVPGSAGLETEANGIFSIKFAFVNKVGDKTEVVVKSNNKDQLELFRSWMFNAKAQVEVLDGSNRYETAVKVAKENADIKTVAKNGNIVLVNDRALVDGLAAAPLAAAVWNKDIDNNGSGNDNNYTRVAPILLTKTDSLPSETKAYIRELIGQQEVQHLDKVTVYLVGGEAVISKGLEKELEELGLRVVRAGGANREETSLKVAEIMAKDGNTNGTVANGSTKVDLSHAFVVGANGEADAMSIAPVAASKGNPIIVEAPNGLSEEAIDTLNGWKNTNTNTKNVTIIGGEKVVSKETEEALVAEKIKVARVFGDKRQDTNAKVIEKYYNNDTVKQLVVSKDGVARKDDLVDALTATSLAVKDKAPIVLATNDLSLSQINALEKKSDRDHGVYVYQVGLGVAKDVIRTIATRIGLAK